MTDEILTLRANSRSQSAFVSAVGRLTSLWKFQKVINSAQKAAIDKAAAKLP
jgi:thiamine biosynthesis lipoprotein ApbE